MGWLGLKPFHTAVHDLVDEAEHPGQDPPAVVFCPAEPCHGVSMQGGSCGYTWQRTVGTAEAKIPLGFRDHHPPTPSSLSTHWIYSWHYYPWGIRRVLVGVSSSADPTVAVSVTAPGILSCLGDLQATPSTSHLSTDEERDANNKYSSLSICEQREGRTNPFGSITYSKPHQLVINSLLKGGGFIMPALVCTNCYNGCALLIEMSKLKKIFINYWHFSKKKTLQAFPQCQKIQ